ncbi:MAG: DNA topoisomerase I [Candidatus Aenigmatarchaeota archaeon]|nr:DNA topoisomerase I [Candidatus Aenigmarchaeota archaeon]
MSDYILLISEKPQAAMKISLALSEGNVKRKYRNNSYWFEFERNGVKHICIPAVGHLFVLDTPSKKWDYPIFEMKWIPSFKKKQTKFTETYYKNLENFKDSKDVIVCCDYDTEGEVIGYNILRFIFDKKDAKRMKFSTLTKQDIIESYENIMNHIDFGQANAGLARHYLDFLWGINTTRALSMSMKKVSKGFKVVSTGRVQGPMLAILAKREKEIAQFKPQPFWELRLVALKDQTEINAEYEKTIWIEGEAKKIYNECKGKDARVDDINKKQQKLMPPVPFDTTTLQTESYRIFGLSPIQTLSIAESLYTQGYISYPRTSSQKLPEKIGYKQIIESISKMPKFKIASQLLNKQLKPREGEKTDPAHPAIYPTAQTPDLNKLSTQEKRIYELIVSRFLAVFGDNAERQVIKVVLDVNGYKFITNGYKTLKLGWIIFYPYQQLKEIELPELVLGEILKVKKLELIEKETKPPDRYTQASILKEAEKHNLGTKATRAQILQTLYDRGYIEGKSIKVTDFGMAVIEALEKYCPEIIDVKLTADFEKEMEMIREEKKKVDEVIEEAKKYLIKIFDEFKKNEENIGSELVKANKISEDQKRTVGDCPLCKNKLKIIVSRKTGKRFIGCSNYGKGCTFSAPLPQKGEVSVSDKICKECSYPMIILKFRGRKPIYSCINMKCKTKSA